MFPLICTIVGIIAGVLLVSWVQPETSGGVGLLIVLSVVVTVALAWLGKISLFRR